MSQWNPACHYRLIKKGSSWLEPEFVSRHRISLVLNFEGSGLGKSDNMVDQSGEYNVQILNIENQNQICVA